MKNFKVTAKEDGKQYWISRSVAVTGVVYTIDHKNKIQFLISKRGSGCPDYVGKWQVTCGYLDFDETGKEAIKRELYEELGLDIKINQIKKFCDIDDPKRDDRQNIIFRYLVEIGYDELLNQLKSGQINKDTKSRGGENNEIDDIALISINEIKNYSWAFNHENLLKEVYIYLVTGEKPKYTD